MKISAKDFFCMTIHQFYLAREQHERSVVEDWRRTRLLIHSMALVMGGKKAVDPDLQVFMPLPFDEAKETVDPVTQEAENRKLLQMYRDKGFL